MSYLHFVVEGMGIASLVISLVIRLIITYLGLLRNDVNLKERLFVAIAWLLKQQCRYARNQLAVISTVLYRIIWPLFILLPTVAYNAKKKTDLL